MGKSFPLGIITWVQMEEMWKRVIISRMLKLLSIYERCGSMESFQWKLAFNALDLLSKTIAELWNRFLTYIFYAFGWKIKIWAFLILFSVFFELRESFWFLERRKQLSSIQKKAFHPMMLFMTYLNVKTFSIRTFLVLCSAPKVVLALNARQ